MSAPLPDSAWPDAVDALSWLDERLYDRVLELLLQLLDGVTAQRALHAQVQDDLRRCRPWTAWGAGFSADHAPPGLAVRGLTLGLAPAAGRDAVEPVLELCPQTPRMQAVLRASPDWRPLPGTGGWHRTILPALRADGALRRGDLQGALVEARVRLGALHAASGLASTCRGQGRAPPVRRGTEPAALRRAIGRWRAVRDALAAPLHRAARRLGQDVRLLPDGAWVPGPGGRALHLRLGWALDSLVCEVVGAPDRGALDRVADAWLDREDCPVVFQPLLGEVGVVLLPDESTWQAAEVEALLLDLGRAGFEG